MCDEIIQEVWRIKEAIAKKHHYSVRKLAVAIMKKEQLAGKRRVASKTSHRQGK